MLLPPATQDQDIRIPRELILVIDTSGSMSGGSIEQANQYVRALEANGGTEMGLALNAALDGQQQGEVGDKSRLRQVLFMTDGGVGG